MISNMQRHQVLVPKSHLVLQGSPPFVRGTTGSTKRKQIQFVSSASFPQLQTLLFEMEGICSFKGVVCVPVSRSVHQRSDAEDGCRVGQGVGQLCRRKRLSKPQQKGPVETGESFECGKLCC